MTKLSDFETWRKIFDLIARKPGLDASRIAVFLDLNKVEMERHLAMLEEHGYIIGVKDNGKKTYVIGTKGKLIREDRRSDDTRFQLYSLIEQHPGLHLSKIASMLAIRKSHAEYHLSYLETNKLIMTVKDDRGYFKRYYVWDNGVGSREFELVGLLRQEQLFKIVLLLIRHPNMKHKDLLKKLDIGSSTLSYHLAKLVDNNVVSAVYCGNGGGYSLTCKKEIVRIILKYRIGNLIDGFSEIWDDLTI